MIGIIFFWFLCAIIASIIGSKKGEACLSFIIGLFLGPFGILVALSGKGNRKDCPYCRELIHQDATVCPRCQKEQNLKEPERFYRGI